MKTSSNITSLPFNDLTITKLDQDNYTLLTATKHNNDRLIEMQQNTDDLIRKLDTTLAECDLKANKIESQ